ncbi:hypothetical protein K438DRAFT_1937594 [Mycena galopus ATCC 62051]|nr:hypothetical protein K438DRAFT_1937594 [Mycena galopus ATCC 62051]
MNKCLRKSVRLGGLGREGLEGGKGRLKYDTYGCGQQERLRKLRGQTVLLWAFEGRGHAAAWDPRETDLRRAHRRGHEDGDGNFEEGVEEGYAPLPITQDDLHRGISEIPGFGDAPEPPSDLSPTSPSPSEFTQPMRSNSKPSLPSSPAARPRTVFNTHPAHAGPRLSASGVWVSKFEPLPAVSYSYVSSPLLEHISGTRHVPPTYAPPAPSPMSDHYTYQPPRARTPAPALRPAAWDTYIDGRGTALWSPYSESHVRNER